MIVYLHILRLVRRQSRWKMLGGHDHNFYSQGLKRSLFALSIVHFSIILICSCFSIHAIFPCQSNLQRLYDPMVPQVSQNLKSRHQ